MSYFCQFKALLNILKIHFLRFEILALIFAFGILQYFYLPYEVKLPNLFYSICICSVLIYRRFHNTEIFLYVVLIVFLSGLLTARLHSVKINIIDQDYKYVLVEGSVEKIEDLPNSTKLILKKVILKCDDPINLERIIVFFKKKQFLATQIGDRIQVNVSLKKYTNPLIPSKIYLNIVNYYDKISAIGFAYRVPVVINKAEKKDFFKEIEIFRKRLNNQIQSKLPGDIGGVIAALSIGERDNISEALNNHIRNSGLSHLLSISGMHLSIVAGIFFLTIRYCLNLIPFFNNKYDLKKVAAYFAMVGSLVYLLISGMKVATIRAYIMANIGLMAILIGNFYNLIRATFITLVLLLVIKPVYVLSAAFQLSFAAVISIAYLLRIQKKPFFRQDYNFFIRLSSHITSNAIFSMAAILGGFWISIFHFYQFSTYGVISNLIAVPLTSIIIMPLIILLLLAYTISCNALFTLFSNLLIYPTKLLINVATLISKLSYSTIFIGQVSGYVIIIGIIASLIALLFQNKFSWILSFTLNLGCLLYAFNYHNPNIIIDSENGNVLLLHKNKIFYTNNSYSSFKKKFLKAAYNVEEIVKLTKNNKQHSIVYDKDKIFFKYLNKQVLILLGERVRNIECDRYDLIINTKSYSQLCSSKYINKNSLLTKGNYYIFLKKKEIIIDNSLDLYGKRDWT